MLIAFCENLELLSNKAYFFKPHTLIGWTGFGTSPEWHFEDYWHCHSKYNSVTIVNVMSSNGVQDISSFLIRIFNILIGSISLAVIFKLRSYDTSHSIWWTKMSICSRESFEGIVVVRFQTWFQVSCHSQHNISSCVAVTVSGLRCWLCISDSCERHTTKIPDGAESQIECPKTFLCQKTTYSFQQKKTAQVHRSVVRGCAEGDYCQEKNGKWIPRTLPLSQSSRDTL